MIKIFHLLAHLCVGNRFKPSNALEYFTFTDWFEYCWDFQQHTSWKKIKYFDEMFSKIKCDISHL